MEKSQLVRRIDFGQRVAEDETDSLYMYFSETVQWEQLEDDEIDIVIGSKGSGKSALFARLINPNSIKSNKGVLIIPAENLTGAPIFNTIREEELLGGKSFDGLTGIKDFEFDQLEKRLIKIWKIYFLMLIAKELKRLELMDTVLKGIFKDLEKLGILEESASLKDIFENVVKYVNKVNVKLGPIELGVEKEKAETKNEKNSLDYFDTSTVFKAINNYLNSLNRPVWVALDRLDAAFYKSGIMRMLFLRSLLRVYLDLKPYSRVKLKLFLRDDIWDDIISDSSNRGFVELSHITKYSKIHWREDMLLNLIVKRIAENKYVLDYLGRDKLKVLKNINEQSLLLSDLFPPEIDNKGKRGVFSWIYDCLKDGNGAVFPRDVIHFFQELKKEQRTLFNLGESNFDNKFQFFSLSAINEALDTVSITKIKQSIFAEYPELHLKIAALKGLSNPITLTTLVELWGIRSYEGKDEKYKPLARKTADKLCNIGILYENIGESSLSYSVGNIYKRVLKIEK